MYISTKQTCVDYRSEIFEELEHLKCYDSPSSQPEPSYHDLASIGFNSSEIDDYWLGPFNSKELAQLDASFQQPTPQQVAHSQSNVDIARSGISHSKKENAIERIEKDYGITRQILEQHFGMTLQQAAKALRDHLVLNRNRSTLVDCRLLDDNDQVPTAPPRATDPVASVLNDLHIAREQNDALRTEIETMRTNMAESQGEVARLKDQLLQQQQDSNARVDHLLKLLASSHSPPPS
ncbi:hypothetical protein MTR67_048944 [Solanum verrucosum]|uniref:Uncharacterized protein n=1 Tax=Solanum verrucosum TaxID=315347 RepID=A0AAF0V1R7_SOLVR|nr:hypothetical protein MTR67_048944 [Solanum verrucosum]